MFLSKARTDPKSLTSAAGAPLQRRRRRRAQDSGAFIPTVTAVSSTPDLQWMVQPTIITSASASASASVGTAARDEPAEAETAESNTARKCVARKGKSQQLSPEEEEKKRIRRERNKMAAAKCRNRRRELTDTLQAETDKLEEEKAALQADIENLLKEKERLEFILATHKPLCQLPEELDCQFPESPQPLPTPQSATQPAEDSPQDASSLQDLEIPAVPSTAISGNSNILLCSSAEASQCDLEASLDVKDELLATGDGDCISAETPPAVPDIDLTGSLGITDWETLYKSVANDLEPLSPPVMSMSTPTCSNYLSVFTFTCPELDSLAEGLDSYKGGVIKAESSVDTLNSPTLLAL